MARRWNQRLEALDAQLEARGAAGLREVVDHAAGRLRWEDERGRTQLDVACQVACTFWLADHTLLLGWADEDLSPAVRPQQLLDYPPQTQIEQPQAANILAMLLAEAHGAAYLVQFTSQQRKVFYLLGPLEDQTAAHQPRAHAHALLQELHALLAMDKLPPRELAERFCQEGAGLRAYGQDGDCAPDLRQQLESAGQWLESWGQRMRAAHRNPFRRWRSAEQRLLLHEMEQAVNDWATY